MLAHDGEGQYRLMPSGDAGWPAGRGVVADRDLHAGHAVGLVSVLLGDPTWACQVSGLRLAAIAKSPPAVTAACSGAAGRDIVYGCAAIRRVCRRVLPPDATLLSWTLL